MADKKTRWIDFSELPKYKKKLPQPLEYDELITAIKQYFLDNKKYNIYGLARHLNMSKKRFDAQYVNSKDENIAELIGWALSVIAENAMVNEEEYARTLRYIMSQAETGRAFIELSEDIKTTEAKVVILPPKS